jgi:hypothetical protein
MTTYIFFPFWTIMLIELGTRNARNNWNNEDKRQKLKNRWSKLGIIVIFVTVLHHVIQYHRLDWLFQSYLNVFSIICLILKKINIFFNIIGNRFELVYQDWSKLFALFSLLYSYYNCTSIYLFNYIVHCKYL